MPCPVGRCPAEIAGVFSSVAESQCAFYGSESFSAGSDADIYGKFRKSNLYHLINNLNLF